MARTNLWNRDDRRTQNMKKYIALIKVGMQKELMYRANFCIGIFSMALSFAVELAIWSAVYQDKAEIENITYEGMVIYAVMTSLLQRFLGNGTDEQIGADFQSGSIVASFLTPLGLPMRYSLQELGKGLLNALALLVLFIPYCIWKRDILPAVQPQQWLLFLLAVILSYLLFSIINYMLGIITFWTNSNIGIYMLKMACINIFSGMFIPVAFYPGLLKDICMALPFQSIYYFPLTIIMGEARGMQIAYGLAGQLLWAGALAAGCLIMHQRAMRQVVIQGG